MQQHLEKILQISFAIFIAILPLYIFRTKIGPLPTTFLELYFFCFVCISCTYIFVVDKLHAISQFIAIIKQNRFVFGATVIFILLGGIAVHQALDFRAGLGIYKAYILEPIILSVILLYIVRKINLIPAFLAGVCVLIAWVFAHVMVQTLFGVFIFAPDEAFLNRATGVFTTSNALGLLLGPFVSVLTGFVLVSRSNKFQLLTAFFATLGVGTVIVSQSLTGLLALVVMFTSELLLYLVLTSNIFNKWLKRLAVILTIAFVAVQLVFFAFKLPSLTPRVIGEGLPNDSLTLRLYLWQGTLSMLKDKPFGNGFSSFPKNYAPYRVYTEDNDRKYFADMPLYPHNMLLNFWTEMGIQGVGLIFLLGMIYLLKSIPYRQYAIGLGLVGALIYTYIHGLTDVPYFKNDLSFVFWILLAFAVSVKYMLEKNE